MMEEEEDEMMSFSLRTNYGASSIFLIIFLSSHDFFFLFIYFLKTSPPYVSQTGLKLSILPQPPKCWDYRWVPLCPAPVPSSFNKW
jgi:hypothetical protein